VPGDKHGLGAGLKPTSLGETLDIIQNVFLPEHGIHRATIDATDLTNLARWGK
jgi:hypothetical protein